MKHKHYDKIMAKAASMELVVLAKSLKWHEVDSDDFKFFNQHEDYFLCLPQHKEAVLCGLNGGSFQVKGFGGFSDSWYLNCDDWRGGDIWYMLESHTSRIKPKKEKRWIGVNVTTGKTTSAYTHDDEGNYAEDEVRLTKGNLSDWQFIEIEVEV